MEQFRFIAGTIFILLGLFIFAIATLGLFRFRYVLNRVHVAAKCDSLASLLVCVGLMFFAGSLTSVIKLLLVVIIIWLSNPVSSHLVCKIEYETNPDINKECEVEEVL